MSLISIFPFVFHLETNDQIERHSRAFFAMIRNYITEHQNDWDVYHFAPTYAYTNHVHRSTKTTPYELFLSRPPSSLSLLFSIPARQALDRATKEKSLRRMDPTLQTAYGNPVCTQKRYKQEFYKRVREVSRNIHTGRYMYLDTTDGSSQPRPTSPDTTTANKLRNSVIGLFEVLSSDVRTFVIDRDKIIERVSANFVALARPVFQPVLFSATLAALAAKIQTGHTNTVERVSEHRADRHGVLKFLVKWSAYRVFTWEPRSHKPQELVSRYLTRIQKQFCRHLPYLVGFPFSAGTLPLLMKRHQRPIASTCVTMARTGMGSRLQ